MISARQGAERTRIADRIRRARLAAGMSQAALAAALGWNQSRVSRLETGRGHVTADLAGELERVLGVDPLAVQPVPGPDGTTRERVTVTLETVWSTDDPDLADVLQSIRGEGDAAVRLELEAALHTFQATAAIRQAAEIRARRRARRP